MIRSDGNGGLNIHKGTFAMLMLIMAIVSCIATVVGYGATIKSDVDWLKLEVQEAGQNYPKLNQIINNRINTAEKAIITNQEKIIALHDDLSEIKTDIKVLLSK